MRILNKLVYACCSIAFGLMALPSCEGGELYDVNAPDWISEKVDSIANSKKDPEEEVLEGMQEDVYSFGNTDYTSGLDSFLQVLRRARWSEVAWSVQPQHQPCRQYLL